MKILLTGASGRVAAAIRDRIGAIAAELLLVDRNAADAIADNEQFVRNDLSNIDSLVNLMAGVDAVIHLAGMADEADFDTIVRSNVVATYNVFEAARLGGVRRVVFASSHHVTGFYVRSVDVDVADQYRPDSLYGVSKVFGEAVGRLYHDKWGLEVVCLRIGVCRPTPDTQEQLPKWLSAVDCAELFVRSVIADISAGYVVCYGASANSGSFWSTAGWAELGYLPSDSSDSIESSTLPTGADHQWQGGVFAEADYGGGAWVARG